MHTLKDAVIEQHIRENFPNARIVSWDEPDSGLKFYTADELASVEEDWFPLCCYKNPDGKAVYGGRGRILHTYTEGETGAGKTTRFAMQSIRALSSMKQKPSFVVVDIHGELVENLYPHLTSHGYQVKILNCDDPHHSDTYNPFHQLVRQCLAAGELDTETLNEIRKISEIMQPISHSQDPIWDQGARSYTNGCILDKFEDLLAGNIPPEAITLYNIIENHFWLRPQLRNGLRDITHYKGKDRHALSIQKMISVTDNADRTRASYFGVVENHYDVFGQPALYRLSSSNTIDIDDFIDKPTAIFLQSGGTKIGDDLISLLMNEIYSTAVQIGRKSPRKLLPRKIHCFLDEFANSNIADGPEFIKMLTTSRKFGMYWHMLIQCDAQLDRKFDADMARIIRANCTEIYMGSHDYQTTVRFAQSCGQRVVESLTSLAAGQYPHLETVDLMTPDRLSLLPEGYIYIKSNRHPLLYSYIEAFYNCPEFVPVEDIRSVYPVNSFDFRATAFLPDDIPPVISAPEFSLLEHLQTSGPLTPEGLPDSFLEIPAGYLTNSLLSAELLKKEEGKLEVALTPAQFDLLRFRHLRGLETELEYKSQRSSPELELSLDSMGPFPETLNEAARIYSNLCDKLSSTKDAYLPEGVSCLPPRLMRLFRSAAESAEAPTYMLSILEPEVLAAEILETLLQTHNDQTIAQLVELLDFEKDAYGTTAFCITPVLDAMAEARQFLTECATPETVAATLKLMSPFSYDLDNSQEDDDDDNE